MADPVVDPAPSPSAPVIAPAAQAPPAAVDPAAPKGAPPLEVKPAVAAPGDPAKPADAPKSLLTAPIVPEKYDFAAVELPKGIELNVDLIAAVSPVFKKFGLSQEAASELVKTHAEALAKAETAGEAKREADFKEWMKSTVTNYQATIRKEWGASTDANIAIAQRGLQRVCTPEMKALLDETGQGNHPEFLKLFYQVGKMVSEDTPPSVVAPANSGKSAAQVLYGATTTPTH